MRRLVVCCDGTWQGVAADSNVSRLVRAYVPDPGSPPAHYVAGVGTSGNPLADLCAGLTGAGLDDSIRDGYAWLVANARPGDRISLFGFSRGAYTARSLAGMIGRVGLVDGAALDERGRADAVRRAYARYRALRDPALRSAPGDGSWSAGLSFLHEPGDPDSPIEFIGVWDTVGALGIPAYVGVPDVLGSRERYEFLDVELDPRIPHARQAVALDEMRGPFRPTLWADPAPGQDMTQVWFPGDHGDVGGGHVQKQLSDVTLAWMAEEAAAAVGLTFDLHRIPDFAPSPEGPAHGAVTGLAGAVFEVAFQPRPRAVPRIDVAHPDPRVSDAAYERQRRLGYRRGITLPVGGSAAVAVPGAAAWTDTHLYLEPGRYRCTATGRWASAGRGTGPEGEDGVWHLSGSAFSAVADRLEEGLRLLVHNPEAGLVGTRRENDLPWLSLVGHMANERRVPVPGGRPTLLPDERLTIGAGGDVTVTRPGYLYAYPNDALGFYGNNSGAVTLTVTRL